MPPGDPWRFEWRRTWDDVWDGPFEVTWREMLSSNDHAHVYHHPSLVRAWAETCGRNAEPAVGLAHDPHGRRVLLPWVVVKYGGRLAVRRTLESAGGDIFGYHTPLVQGDAADAVDWPAFWRAARQATRDTCDQALFRFLEPSYGADPPMRLTSEPSPILDLSGLADLDAVLDRCSSHHRVDVRRQLRRAAALGEVTLWVAGAGDADAATASLRNELLPAYEAVWASRPFKNSVVRPALIEFLERIVGEGLADGWAHYSVLRVGETPVAWHLGYLHQGRLYWWLPTHDSAWANYSPGKMLLALLVREGCRRRWSGIHFLTGDHTYKAAWNPIAQTLTAVAWSAPTIRGRLMSWYDQRRKLA
jgi:CelD/BcsL family acetyltransferase involved in cellulose biosynthesis